MANVYNSQLDAYSLYHQTMAEQHTHASLGGPALPALGHALSGSTGSAISNICIYPLDLVITRLKVQRSLRNTSSSPEPAEYKGVVDAFQQIYSQEGGIAAFYSGIVQDTGKSIADSFLFFLFYNYLREKRLEGRKNLPVLEELGVGSLAGAASKFFTTPIANIVTRKQTASMLAARSPTNSSTPTTPSVSLIARSIRAEKGITGFWSGYSASIILTLNPSLTFLFFNTLKRFFLSRDQRDAPGARATFLLAAISKAMASTITYPFSLAKSRAQVSSKPSVSRSSIKKVEGEISNVSSIKDAEKAGEDAGKLAKQTTAFHSVAKIWREEGIGALYEGVWGEIFRGFFSHGITMLVKEEVHRFIIAAYYWILKKLNKFPSAAEIQAQAGEKIGDAASEAKDRLGDAVQMSKEAAERAREGVEGAREGLGGFVDRVKGGFGAVVEKGQALAESGVVQGKEALHSMFEEETGERLAVVSGSATGASVTAEKVMSEDAGHLLGNAQHQLGPLEGIVDEE